MSGRPMNDGPEGSRVCPRYLRHQQRHRRIATGGKDSRGTLLQCVPFPSFSLIALGIYYTPVRRAYLSHRLVHRPRENALGLRASGPNIQPIVMPEFARSARARSSLRPKRCVRRRAAAVRGDAEVIEGLGSRRDRGAHRQGHCRFALIAPSACPPPPINE